jgi:hypothetical protein
MAEYFLTPVAKSRREGQVFLDARVKSFYDTFLEK